jgi:hypothetical protein
MWYILVLILVAIGAASWAIANRGKILKKKEEVQAEVKADYAEVEKQVKNGIEAAKEKLP